MSVYEVLEMGQETPFPNTVHKFKEPPFCASCTSDRATIRCVRCGIKHCSACETLAKDTSFDDDDSSHSYELVMCDRCWRLEVETGRTQFQTLFEPFPVLPSRLRRIQPVRVLPRCCPCHAAHTTPPRAPVQEAEHPVAAPPASDPDVPAAAAPAAPGRRTGLEVERDTAVELPEERAAATLAAARPDAA